MHPPTDKSSPSGQYKTIKKGFRTSISAPGPSSTSKPSSSKTKTTKKTPTSTPTTGKGGRKRKANEAALNSDDEEPVLIASKASKVKREDQGDGLSAEVFKAEPMDLPPAGCKWWRLSQQKSARRYNPGFTQLKGMSAGKLEECNEDVRNYREYKRSPASLSALRSPGAIESFVP